MIHYVYRLTYKKSSVMKYYIGKHSGELDDIGKTYFTSSSSFRNFFKKNVNDFDIKIVRVFDKCEDALLFERKYLIRVNAAASELFFNKCNSGSTGKYDNTGLVHTTLKENNLNVTVNKDYYRSHKDEFVHNRYKTIYKDALGNHYFCTKDDAKANNYMGINKGLVHTTFKDNTKVTVSKDYYHSHKDEFLPHIQTNRVSAYDKISKKYVNVSKDEFDKNPNLIGANSLHPEIYEQCPYCKNDITIQNIKTHVKTHEKNTVWVTDGYNIFKCKESIYYLHIKDINKKFYLIDKQYKIYNNYKVPYNGEMHHIRYVAKIRKNCYINENGEQYET